MPAERAGLLGEIDALPGPMPRRRTAARGSARRGRSPAGIRPQQRTRVRLPMRLRLANCDCLEVGIIARFRHHIGRHAGGDWSFPRRLAPGTRLGEWLDRFRDDLRRSRGRTHDDARRRVGGRFASQTLVGRHTGYLLGARFRDYPFLAVVLAVCYRPGCNSYRGCCNRTSRYGNYTWHVQAERIRQADRHRPGL